MFEEMRASDGSIRSPYEQVAAWLEATGEANLRQRQSEAEALFRLGMSDESATLIGALSPAQIVKIASGNMLLCRFRVDDEMVWNLLTNHSASKVDNDATTKLHASILMAGRYSETM